MKKEQIVYIVITLVVGVLVGVIFTNARKNVSSDSVAPSQVAAPATNYQQQITMLEGLVAKDPGNRNAWVQLGNNYFDSEQPMKAVEAYGKALELNGNDPDVLTDQGVMYRRLGWFDKAVKNFEMAFSIAPNHIQSLFNLGIVYRYDLQDSSKASEVWERYLMINPTGPGADQVRAELNAIKNSPALPTPK